MKLSRLTLSLGLTSVLASSSALAQEARGFSDDELFQSRTEIYSGNSEQARSEKSFFALGKAGFALGAIPGAGLEGGYNLNAQSQILASYNRGEIDLKDEMSTSRYSPTYTKALVVSQELDAQYRRFFGNSFNLIGGLGYRQIDIDVEAYDVVGKGSYTTRTDSFVAITSIGNLWTWDNGFSLGARWIGVSVPLSSSSESSYNEDGLLVNKEEVEDLNDKIGKTVAVQLPMLQVGYMF
jgi:hypothetical protein